MIFSVFLFELILDETTIEPTTEVITTESSTTTTETTKFRTTSTFAPETLSQTTANPEKNPLVSNDPGKYRLNFYTVKPTEGSTEEFSTTSTEYITSKSTTIPTTSSYFQSTQDPSDSNEPIRALEFGSLSNELPNFFERPTPAFKQREGTDSPTSYDYSLQTRFTTEFVPTTYPGDASMIIHRGGLKFQPLEREDFSTTSTTELTSLTNVTPTAQSTLPESETIPFKSSTLKFDVPSSDTVTSGPNETTLETTTPKLTTSKTTTSEVTTSEVTTSGSSTTDTSTSNDITSDTTTWESPTGEPKTSYTFDSEEQTSTVMINSEKVTSLSKSRDDDQGSSRFEFYTLKPTVEPTTFESTAFGDSIDIKSKPLTLEAINEIQSTENVANMSNTTFKDLDKTNHKTTSDFSVIVTTENTVPRVTLESTTLMTTTINSLSTSSYENSEVKAEQKQNTDENLSARSLTKSFDQNNEIQLKLAEKENIYPCASNIEEEGCWRFENNECVLAEESKCVSLQCTSNQMQGLIKWTYFNFSDGEFSRDKFIAGKQYLSVGNSGNSECQINYDSELDAFEFQFILGECDMKIERKTSEVSGKSSIVFLQSMSVGDETVNFECIYPTQTVTNSIESALEHENDVKVSHGFSQESDWGPQFDVLYFADQDFESARIRHGSISLDPYVLKSTLSFFQPNFSA